MEQSQTISTVGKIYIGILLVIFAGIIFHAPLSVALGTLWPNFNLLIKSWKEILMLIAGLMSLYLMNKNHQFKILRNLIIIAIAAYAILHLSLLGFMSQSFVAAIAGLAIDLRYVLFFALVYIAMCLYPNKRKMFIQVGIAGALIVLIFAILQVFILPKDILKYLGYSINTINPYLTVDKNNAFIRINSTFRGPNPLGAYAGLVLTLLTAAIFKHKIKKERWPLTIAVVLSAGGVVALWASYSRSALLATVIAISIVIALAAYKKLFPKLWITIGVIVVITAGGIYLTRDTSFVSNVILHVNPTGGSLNKSNEGHINSLSDGVNQLIKQPMGAGIGSTGSASMLVGKGEIIENQYLFIAHEVGWLGLALFLFIFVSVLVRLWKLRDDWLALGVFASGIGLALICLVLPILTDDMVSIIWWGLAAIALFPNNKDYN